MVPGKAIPRRPKPAELQGNTTSGNGVNPSLPTRQPRAQHEKRLRRLKESVKDLYSGHFFARFRAHRDPSQPITRVHEDTATSVLQNLGIPKGRPPSYDTALRQPTVCPQPMPGRQEMPEETDTASPPQDIKWGAVKPQDNPQQLFNDQESTTGDIATRFPVAALQNNPELTGVGSHLDYRRPHDEAELSLPLQAPGPTRSEATSKPHGRNGSNDSMAKRALVQRACEQNYASNQTYKSSGDSIKRRSTSLSTESGTTNEVSRPTSPCRHGGIYDSPVSTPCTSYSSLSGTLAEYVRSGEYMREKLLPKRFSWVSNSSTHSEIQLDATINKRHNPIPSIDANVNSTLEALKVTASLSAPASSLIGTEAWVAQQHLTQPRRVAQTVEDDVKKGIKDQNAFKKGEVSPPINAPAAAAGNTICLSTIEEANSDAGCSAHDSQPKSPNENTSPGGLLTSNYADRHNGAGSEYTWDLTKSPSIHSKLHSSTPPTSIAEGSDLEALESLDASESDCSSIEIEDEFDESFSLALLRSQLDPKLHPFVTTLKECVVFLILERVSAWVKSCSPEQDAGGSGGASGSDSGGNGNTGATNNRSGAKRSCNGSGQDRPDRPNGDDQDKRRKMDDTANEEGPEKDLQVFACPFLKRYPNRDWPNKCKKGWLEIHRLKAHIYSDHKLPPLCRRCFSEFDDESSLQKHQEEDCERNPSPPEVLGITANMHLELKNRKGVQKMSGTKYWERIYKTIFPDVADVPDPFWKADDLTRETLREPKVQAEIERKVGPELVRELQTKLGIGGMAPEKFESIVLNALSKTLRGVFDPAEHQSSTLATTIPLDDKAGPSQEKVNQPTQSNVPVLDISSPPSNEWNKVVKLNVQSNRLEHDPSNIDPPQAQAATATECVGTAFKPWAPELHSFSSHNQHVPSSFDFEALFGSDSNISTQFSGVEPTATQVFDYTGLDLGSGVQHGDRAA